MEADDHQLWWNERGSAELQGILFDEWDPIGLKAVADAPRDEYDHYAGQLARRLRTGATPEEIAAVLDGYRADMGLEPSPDPPPLELARRIHEWYARSTRTAG
jgi:hypothetical protein